MLAAEIVKATQEVENVCPQELFAPISLGPNSMRPSRAETAPQGARQAHAGLLQIKNSSTVSQLARALEGRRPADLGQSGAASLLKEVVNRFQQRKSSNLLARLFKDPAVRL